MAAQPTSQMSVAEYLALERRQQEKYEYYDGEIVLQAGASLAHNLTAANIIGILHQQLRSQSCTVLPGDMRVCTPEHKQYLYPDAMVVCGTPLFDDEYQDTIINPVVVIEVLSPSTELYDRGRKFQAYRTIPMMQEYLLVAQHTLRVERFTRQNDMMWLMTEYAQPDQMIELASISCVISLASIYEKVSLADASEK